jgi:hypothetical protein
MSFCSPAQRTLLRFAVAVILLQAPAAARAGSNDNARFLLHLAAPVSKNQCGLASNPPSCGEIETRGQVGTDYFAYVIISNLNSTAGLSVGRFGITYDGAAARGVDVSSWTSCADGLEFPSAGWPAAGTGIAVTWQNCFHPPIVNGDAMAVVGYFEVNASTPDEIRVTPHPSFNQAAVGDCAANEDVIEMVMLGTVIPFGWATFSADGTVWGSNPCGLDAGSCHLSGPTAVDTGQTGIQYTMDPDEVTANGSWRVGGNAEITSSNNSAAMVHATTPGTFSIAYQRQPDCWVVDGCGCYLTVQVQAPTPVRPTTWGWIKAGYAIDPGR